MTAKDTPTERQGRLLDVGRALVSERDPEEVLQRVLVAARDLTSARYAALGILADDRSELERFVYLGIDEETRQAIGPLPRGRGVLGELIRDPRPLRIADIGRHPNSYGFPEHHPAMRTFLGAPVTIQGEAWGNLYLAEKAGGAQFDEDDERVVVALAQWAAVAIENARLYRDLQQRGADLEKAVSALEASADISRLGVAGLLEGRLAAPDPNRLLDVIARRARELMGARSMLLLAPDQAELTVAAAAGQEVEQWLDRTIQTDSPLAQAVRLEGPCLLTPDHRLGSELTELVGAFTSAVCVPLVFRDRGRGMLIAIDQLGDRSFLVGDELILDTFAMSAAAAVTTARTVELEKLHLSMAAAEGERRHWARELHDETLQDLGALRFSLELAGSARESETARKSMDRALGIVDRAIENLQRIITELRPALLDDLGLEPALEAWAAEVQARSELVVETEIDLSGDGTPEQLSDETEAIAYRIVQEALNNVVKHAGAKNAKVAVRMMDSRLRLTVQDDGSGFDPAAPVEGFGLVGMRERAALIGGRVSVASSPGAGTVVRADFPVG